MKKIIAYHIALVSLALGLGLGMNSCALSTGSTTNNVTNFTVIATWTGSLGEVISSVYAEGTNIYAAAGSDGLYIFSSGLSYIAKFSTNLYPNIKDVVVKNYASSKFAIVANGFNNGKGGVMTINVTDLTNMYYTNTNEYTGLTPNAIVVKDDVTNIFTADQTYGFQTYTNSWSVISGTNKRTVLPVSGADIAVSGTKAYVAAKTSGVYVIDFANNDGIMANVNSTLSFANAVAVSGSGDGTLLAVGDILGLVVFNMDSPDSSTSPRYLGGYYGTPVYDVAIDGNDFYLALGTAGIVKLTRTPPATFTLMKQYNDGAAYYKLFYLSTTGYLYAAAGKDGIRVLR